jgi:DNA-binding response OmpR family regulator
MCSTRVLTVDADGAIADLYALKLRVESYSVAVAHDAPSAEQQFWQTSPVVVSAESSESELARHLSDEGETVLPLTNDQDTDERPPAGGDRGPHTLPGSGGYRE